MMMSSVLCKEKAHNSHNPGSGYPINNEAKQGQELKSKNIEESKSVCHFIV
jgi:hypothetical protein